MTDNYIKIIKGGYIKAYLNYYLDLKYLLVEPFDWGYKIEATTRLNDIAIDINIENNNQQVEKLCDNALSNIKTEIFKHFINPHL